MTLDSKMLPSGKDVHVALRPIDIAGNVGTLSEVTVDTSPKPKKKRAKTKPPQGVDFKAVEPAKPKAERR